MCCKHLADFALQVNRRLAQIPSMKKKSTSQSAFFNLCVLIGLVVVLAGVFLTLLGFGAFSNASAQVVKVSTPLDRRRPAPRPRNGSGKTRCRREIRSTRSHLSMQTTERLWVAMGPSSKPPMEETAGSFSRAEQPIRFMGFLLSMQTTAPRLVRVGQFSEQLMVESPG